jgi:hypothetical protein
LYHFVAGPAHKRAGKNPDGDPPLAGWEEDNPDTVTPDSAFSTGKTQNFYTKVSSQDYSRNYLGLLLEILLDIFPNIPLDF